MRTKHADPAIAHALRARAMVRSKTASRASTFDENSVLAGIKPMVEAHFQRLALADATFFELPPSIFIGQGWKLCVRGRSADDDIDRSEVSEIPLFKATGDKIPKWVANAARCAKNILIQTTLGREALLRSLFKTIAADLARLECDFVMRFDKPEPAGWAALEEQSALSSSCPDIAPAGASKRI